MQDITGDFEEVLNELRDYVKTNFKFTLAIGFSPALRTKMSDSEDENQGKVILLLPNEFYSWVPEMIMKLRNFLKKHKIEVSIYTLNDLWELCYRANYKIVEEIATSFPVYDTGILEGLRASVLYKHLLLRKLGPHLMSYIIIGSILSGTMLETSDVDVHVIINDTDLQEISRIEVKEKLRTMCYTYAEEATKMAKSKYRVSVAVHLLTEYWEAVREANPIIFILLRDGVPLYDRGIFVPWKLLLKMGQIKPSPEAIDMFMALGENINQIVQEKLNSIVTEDIYWGVIVPSQAVLMLFGFAPLTPKETVEMMYEILYKKEKILEEEHVRILERVVKFYKHFAHERIKKVSGTFIDSLLEDVNKYMERLKELRKVIEMKFYKRMLRESYGEIEKLVKRFTGGHGEDRLKKELEKIGIMRKGVINSLKKIRDSMKKKDISLQEMREIVKESQGIINLLKEGLERKVLRNIKTNKDISF